MSTRYWEDLKPGDKLLSPNSGITYNFVAVEHPPSPGRDGKILVNEGGGVRSFYARIFPGITWKVVSMAGRAT